MHLTLLLCPALGDHKYASRVGTVLGQPFLLPPQETPTPRTQVSSAMEGNCCPMLCFPKKNYPPQVLDAELMSRLQLSPHHRLPLHLHLQQLVLPHTVLSAPPPPHFLCTLRLLGLPSPPLPPH